MRTDELIHALVADRGGDGRSIGRRLAVAVAIGFAISAILFWIVLGPRADVAAAAGTIRFDLKIVEMLLLSVLAVPLAFQLVHPGVSARGRALALLAAPGIIMISVVIELMVVDRSQWLAALVGSNSLKCLTAIPLLSLPPLAVIIASLRHGAPTRPALTGAVAGLAAGGIAGALYAIQCTDDSPLFVATWYTAALAATSLLGAALARIALRW